MSVSRGPPLLYQPRRELLLSCLAVCMSRHEVMVVVVQVKREVHNTSRLNWSGDT